ncbi:hypothetical protein H0H92_014059 [Tricholoma furcatifolium]|nr:hypothetical protein H0H92_014059 [Tricholoma furcatifolium]
MLINLISVLLLAVECSLAIVYDAFESLPDVQFDFIVIGGGTAGNVIANRLTEDPGINVLVIESGPSNLHVINSIVPFFVFNLENSPYDWNFTTTPQTFVNDRVIDFPRGHILGGSSSINAMFYTRGSSSDFDRFSQVTGDNGWSWDNLQPYVRKNERWTAPADHHNTTGQFNPAVHGFHGINAVSLSGFPHSFDSRIIQTTSELPEEFPFNLDTNSGNPLGLGWLQTTIDDGRRSSSATSYLGPEFINRPNLHVLLKTRVTRVLKASNSVEDDHPTFLTVEFANEDTRTPLLTLTATKEVILSAGTIGTPHILLSSGIGDAGQLTSIGITPLVDLPDVGKNFSDQPAVGNSWSVNSNITLDNISNNATLEAELFEEWKKDKMGPLVASQTTHLAWSRIPADSAIFNNVSDPASGPNSPHYELVFGPKKDGGGFSTTPGHFISIGTTVVSPTSRGTVSINSTNPFDPPLINPNFLSTEFDIFAARGAIQSAISFLAAPVWKDIVIGPAGGLAGATTDELLDEYIRNGLIPALHAVGTAAMSPKGADFGVVDPDLLVKGVSGLRVVDASVMPFVPSGHTQAPVYIISERAADLIKDAWGLQ